MFLARHLIIERPAVHCLLIHPKFPDTFWSFKHALKFIRKKAANPPLGLLTVAALLPKQWPKRVVDLNVRPLRDKDLKWADYAFIGAMAVQRESAAQTIKKCKAAGLKVVAGGPLFCSEHEAFDGVDHFVLNEAELTLPRFLTDLAQGRPKPIYQSNEFADVSQSPIPSWDLLPMKRYASMSLQFSRGCPFNCDFCNVTALFGHRPRLKSNEQVLAELDTLYAAGWRGQVFFVDDNFIGNKKYLMEHLLPALIQWRRSHTRMPFNTEASINLADDETLMAMMVEAGFDAVFIGIETPDESSLNECNKKQNKNRNLLQNVHKIQAAGLMVQAGFIVGFDNDTPSIFQRQIDFIQKSGISTAMVGLLQAIPGTKLHKRLQSEGRLAGEMADNTGGKTNIIPVMDRETLYEGYKQIMRHIYAPKQYYHRARQFLAAYQPSKIKAPMDFQRLLALLRSMVRLGIFGRERYQFWKLFFWSLMRRPKLFPLAITLAIYGHHFRKMCDLYIR
jgi:radical SAM superfamily enzyme YgiQ (UPF0313 family)